MGILTRLRGALKVRGNLRLMALLSFLRGARDQMRGVIWQPFALSLGISMRSLGGLESAMDLTRISVQPILGGASDAYGRKRFLVLRELLLLAALTLFIVAGSWQGLLVGVLLVGLYAGVEPVWSSLVAESAEAGEMGMAYSILNASYMATGLFAPVAAGLLADAYGYDSVFYVSAGLGLFILLLVLLKLAETKPRVEGEGITWSRFARPLLDALRPPPRLRGFYLSMTVDLFAFSLGHRLLYGMLTKSYGYTPYMLSLMSAAMTEASVKATLKAIDDARGEGVDVNFDLIPHHLTGGIYISHWLVGLLLPWLRLSGSREKFAETLRMTEFRAEIKETVSSGKWYGLNPNINPAWAGLPNIVSCKDDRFVDKTVAEVAEELGVGPLEALMEILAADPYTKAVRKGDDDSTKLLFYRHPEMMIGVDTFALDDKWECRHPPWYLPNENSYGGFPRYFRRAVRETETLTLEEAVRKVTSLPARKFKLTDRGVIRAGAYADIVVMNPKTVTDRGDQLNPRRYPEGIEHVIVNGVPVVEEAKHTGARPGKILYRE